MKNEIWRDVVGWKGWYSVSNYGRVRRDRGGYRNAVAGRILKPSLAGEYAIVFLCRHGRRRGFTVHTLIARAFLGPKPRRGYEVDHKDGIKTRNLASNLQWVPHLVNYRRAQALGLMHKARGEEHGNATLTEDIVRNVRRLKKSGMTQRAIAFQTGLTETHVSRIVRRKLWAHVE